MSDATLYLNLNGIPSSEPPSGETLYLWFHPHGIWRLSRNDGFHEVASVCMRIHDAFRMAIMQGVPYDDLVYQVPQFAVYAGLNSEAPLSSVRFQEFLRRCADFPELNRFLYLYDCERLVSSIQECSKEVVQILGEFYLALNTQPFFGPDGGPQKPEEVRYSSSPVTTKLVAFLNFILIRLHSLMDYAVKVATEAERLRADFRKYPRMSSLGMQFGDRKGLKFNGRAGTLFENCPFVAALETLRNHIIHDAMLDEMPKAYEKFVGGVVAERFILFPDMTDGRLDRYVNRNLFFGSEDKINLRLPDLICEFHRRLAQTLDAVFATLRQRYQG